MGGPLALGEGGGALLSCTPLKGFGVGTKVVFFNILPLGGWVVLTAPLPPGPSAWLKTSVVPNTKVHL